MPQIHPTAIVAPGAMLAEDVVIDPYCPNDSRELSEAARQYRRLKSLGSGKYLVHLRHHRTHPRRR